MAVIFLCGQRSVKLFKRIIFLLFITSCFFIGTSATAAVYKYIDNEGNAAFSDTWRPGATEIEMKEPQSFSVKKISAGEEKPVESNSAQMELAAPAVTLVSPIDQDYIHGDDEGTVSIQASTDVKFEEGFRLQALLDGKAYGDLSDKENFSIIGVVRGMHMLQLSLLDKDGNSIAKSETVSFYMKRNIVK